MKTTPINKIPLKSPAIIASIIFVVVAVSITIFVLLTIGSNESSIKPTLDEAKNELVMVEDELVKYVPQNAIVNTYPRAEKSDVLFKCDGENTYYWPGSAQFDIRPETDSAAIMQKIHDDWSKKPGWDVKWLEQNADNNVYHLDMQRDDGLNFGIMNLDNNTQLQFLSFSPCFKLSNYDPNTSY